MSERGRAQGSQLLHEKSYFMSSKPRALNKNRDLRIGHKGKRTSYFYIPRRHRIVPGLHLWTIDINPQNPRAPEPGARRDEPSVDATPVAAGQEWDIKQSRLKKRRSRASCVRGHHACPRRRSSLVGRAVDSVGPVVLLPTPVARGWVDGGGYYVQI